MTGPSASPSAGSAGPIEEYLDQLLLELRGDAGNVRRILAETEDHLRAAADEEVASGLSPVDAEQRAVERFGPARMVARRFATGRGLLSARSLWEVGFAVALLSAIGLAAIGVSGAVAAGMGAGFGKSFVAGDQPGVTYTAGRCADYREYHPEAPTCGAAAVAHHYDEVVGYRLDAGVLGVIGLAAWLVIRRRRRPAAAIGFLPDGFIPTVGASLFGVAGLGLTLLGTSEVLMSRDAGGGSDLSGGIVALLVAAAFVPPLLRTLRHRAAVAV